MTSSKTAPGLHEARDRGTVLSTIWVFLVLNFAYADIFTLFFDKSASNTTELSTGAILFFAVLMELAVAAVVLSRVLPYAWNRWTNIGVAVVHIALLAYSLSGGAVTASYAFFAAVEMATLLFVVGCAWTWRRQSQVEQVVVAAGA